MATAVTMPALGESVTEGTVTTWLKSVGDTVAVDEAIVEVSTDKVDSEVPSPVAGVLLEILVGEDETVEVGTQIALIGDPSEAGAAAETPAEVAAEPVQAPAAPAPAPAAPAAPAQGTEVTMPALGESVTEGTVTTWLKSVGDAVEADEPLLEVSTDKVDSEVPSPVSGFLAEIRVEEDETVGVGTVLAVISASAPSEGAPAAQALETPTAPAVPTAPAPPATPAAPAPAAPTAPAAPAPAAPAAPAMSFDAPSVPVAPSSAPAVAPQAPAPSTLARAGYVTPIVRKLAREAGIDIDTLTGTGVGGRIRREDVEAAVAARRTD
ncbi:biotin/lipoyl-containing protein, partial [Schaalia sp.]|uniref:biotin/lipoyl-containing protein n=1 Tax=Schaalia sp. TaxID=2691890 RepID=UPI003D0E4FD2